MIKISNIFTLVLAIIYLTLVVMQNRLKVEINQEKITPLHYQQRDVQIGISKYPPLQGVKKPRIRGGVVSHHLLAQVNIARYFQNLSNFEYNQVIILGPNHGELGNHSFVTSNLPWETPYGEVIPFSSSLSLPIDNQVMRSDHSLEAIMPFIKVYLPEVKVLPILVKASSTNYEIEELVSQLIPVITDNTLVLVSTDFSHYLRSDEAYQNDQITLGLIKMRDYDKISKLGNEYLDSPNSIIIFLKILDKLGVTELQVYDHTDGSKISGTPNAATTTYYFLNYYDAQ